MTTTVVSEKANADYRPARRNETLGARVLERSDNVLWTVAPPGILLHNLELRLYFELDALGYVAWGFLDGGRTVDEVVSRCLERFPRTVHEQTAADLIEIIKTLQEHGFVKDREDA